MDEYIFLNGYIADNNFINYLSVKKQPLIFLIICILFCFSCEKFNKKNLNLTIKSIEKNDGILSVYYELSGNGVNGGNTCKIYSSQVYYKTENSTEVSGYVSGSGTPGLYHAQITNAYNDSTYVINAIVSTQDCGMVESEKRTIKFSYGCAPELNRFYPDSITGSGISMDLLGSSNTDSSKALYFTDTFRRNQQWSMRFANRYLRRGEYITTTDFNNVDPKKVYFVIQRSENRGNTTYITSYVAKEGQTIFVSGDPYEDFGQDNRIINFCDILYDDDRTASGSLRIRY